MPAIPFDNTYARLPEHFYARQDPSPVPSPHLVAVNLALAQELGIRSDWMTSQEALAVFAGNEIAPGSEPLAQVYAGHQFGGFSPQLGDGRALLLGEVMGVNGRRDLQLKGSGHTPYSRRGDGRSALGPVLREYLVSEAMHTLGVPTTRALAAVSTGREVLRQEGPQMGGIMTRVAASHLRVGTMQYYYARSDSEALQTLADYTIARHYPHAAASENPYLTLLEEVISAQAKLIAHWMSLGFIHGVMNTDNFALSGETIDYGPCAFMERFHPDRVFSSIDRNGRYAWGNQPHIGLWNLSRFAETLLELLDPDSEKGKSQAEGALKSYHSQFSSEYQRRFSAKLGIPLEQEGDFIRLTLETLAKHSVDFTLFFRKLTQVADGESTREFLTLFNDKEAGENWLRLWEKTTNGTPLQEQMHAANPIRIPRNHRVEEVIQAGYQGDFQPFEQLQKALACPFEESSQFADYESPASSEEEVRETFCGT